MSDPFSKESLNDNIPTLEGNVVKRPLHFFWLVDCSGSMEGSKINSLNRAIAESIPAIADALQNHAEVQIMMRVIKFADRGSWHIGPTPVPIENFIWSDLSAGGTTATASAIDMLVSELDIEKMSKRTYPPVCILLSDGHCTESEEKYNAVINTLDKMPWGKKAVRLVIAIGNENDYDSESLLKFTNHKEVGLLQAKNPEQLIDYIKWASVAASVSASASKSQGDPSNMDPDQNVILPTPPSISGAGDVF